MKRYAPIFVIAGMALLGLTRAASAGPAEISARADNDTVGVGETAQVEVRASSSGEAIDDPQLGAAPGFQVVGPPQLMPSESVSIINSSISRKRMLVASYVLKAVTAGSHTVGPASMRVGTQRVKAPPLVIKVVPAGQAPPRRQAPNQGRRPSFSPFDPFGGFFGDFMPEPPPPQPTVQTDPAFSLPASRGSILFLHALIDKTNVVAGEPVTVSTYMYIGARFPNISLARDIIASDFIRRDVMDKAAVNKSVGLAEAGGMLWEVRQIGKQMFFPLRTGDLAIGSMALNLSGLTTGTETRESESFVVHVTEPPQRGRPPGYTLGDVGKFELAVTVTPREVDEDGAVAVELQLSGTGNMPSRLEPPVQTGIDWLEVQTRENIGLTPGGKWGGTRTFSYILKPHRSGTLELGDWSFPYWNLETKRYAVARANLGSIQVKARPLSEALAAEKNAPPDPFAGLPSLRKKMREASVQNDFIADSRLFWGALLALPLSYGVAMGLSQMLGRLRSSRDARKTSPANQLKQRLAAAEEALARQDARSVDASIARALETAAQLYRRIDVRNVGPDRFVQMLLEASVSPLLAHRCETLLKAGEASRFALDDVSLEVLAERLREAKALIQDLKGRT